ncbi:MAG: energy transducer TonB [Cytophagales bacterium]|nr:energy transducer TonB [Cytophagales bacterium]
MKIVLRWFLFFLLFIGCVLGYGQDKLLNREPTPSKGILDFMIYLKNNIKYPPEALKEQIEGKVFITFIVDTLGSMSDFELAKGIGYGCDEEAYRVLSSYPGKWDPGIEGGKIVNSRMAIPISFKLAVPKSNSYDSLGNAKPNEFNTLIQVKSYFDGEAELFTSVYYAPVFKDTVNDLLQYIQNFKPLAKKCMQLKIKRFIPTVEFIIDGYGKVLDVQVKRLIADTKIDQKTQKTLKELTKKAILSTSSIWIPLTGADVTSVTCL